MLYPTYTYQLPPIIQNFTQIQLIPQTPCEPAHAKTCNLQPVYAEAENTYFFLCLETTEIFRIFKN